MVTNNKQFGFEFRVETWNVDMYTERRRLLKELESIPNTKVSAICERAAWGGFEEHVVTVISVIANILTIANILHKRLRKKARTGEKASQNSPVVYVFIGNEKVILNDMSRDEIISLLREKISNLK